MFQPFVDKENASQGTTAVAGFRPIAGHRAQAGKTFLGNTTLPKAKGLVSRQALGDVKNQANQTTSIGNHKGGLKEGLSAELLKPKKALLSRGNTLVKSNNKQKLKEEVSVKVVAAEEHTLPEIETMSLHENHDTYEDIWPSFERPGTYASEFKEWRPCRLLRSLHDLDQTRDSDGCMEDEDVRLDRDDVPVSDSVIFTPVKDLAVPQFDDLFMDHVDLYSAL